MHVLSIAALLGGATLSALRPLPTYAATLTSVTDTLSSVTKSVTGVSHVIQFTTPTGVGESTDTITITFASGFDISGLTLPADVALTHGAGSYTTNTETVTNTGATATAWNVGRSGQVLTLTAPTDGVGAASLAAGNQVRITLSGSGITNPSTAASYEIALGGTFGDSATVEVGIVDNASVAVTATVDESLAFSMTGNSISFGTLSSLSATTGTNSFTISTNATGGYVTTVKGATLTSGSDTITAVGSTAATSTAGTEQFGINITASGGVGAVDSTYAGTGAQYGYGATSSTADTVASSSAPSDATTYSATYVANIAATTQPGSYTATLVYVTTGTF